MNSQSVASPSPLAQRAGRPRSFWAILGLSIVTCSIYYIVYHYLVAGELKRCANWKEEEDYKPGIYVWMYTAVVLFWLFISVGPGIVNAIAAVKSGMAGLGGMEQFTSPRTMMILTGMQLLLSGLGVYATYYFLKLQDAASDKVGLPRKGVLKPIAAYGAAFAISVVLAIVSIVGGFFDEMASASSPIDIMKMAAVGGFYMMFALINIALLIYFLWEQTELVNRIWLEGHFAQSVAPVGPTTPIAPTYLSPGTQSAPHGQAPPTQAPPGTVPQTGDASDEEKPLPPPAASDTQDN
ncbi:MAG: DUF4234 domain-containing protein [candidate division Zixibacteria bacterium]|nr:DUF4234 domain-containing protein [candidate division Zixibacteria bacterium]